MICPQCHSENRPGDKFCEQCGFPLSSSGQGGEEDNIPATLVGAPISGAALTRVDDPSQTFTLGNRVVVGRLDTCDIPIHDKSVSREHARLSQLPGGYVVEDLGSTNGTLVNGERVTDAVILRPGDTVTFGAIEFRFQEETAAVPGGSSLTSTQPFVYRPPEQEPMAAQPGPFGQPQPAPEPEPQAEPEPAFDFPPLQPFTPIDTVPPPPVITPAPTPLPAADIPPSIQADSQQQSVAETRIEGRPEPSVQQQPIAQSVSTPSPEPIPLREPVEPSRSQPEAERAPQTESAASLHGAPGDVVDAATRLADLVRSLADELDSARSEQSGLRGRISELEEAGSVRDSVRRALEDMPARTVSGQQLRSTQDALDQLIQDPRDIELLLQLGRQAADLAAIVNEYSQLRRGLERVADAVGVTLPR